MRPDIARATLPALLLYFLILPHAVRAQDADPVRQNQSLAILPSYVLTDRALARSGHGAGVAVAYGRPLMGQTALELAVSGTILESGVPAATDYYQKFIHIDATHPLAGASARLFTPYVLGGMAGGYDDFNPDSRDTFSLILEAGIGVLSRPVLGDRVRLRAEVRYQYDVLEQGHHEAHATLGIQVPLGRPEPTIKYVSVEKVVVREVVREIPAVTADSDGDGIPDNLDWCADTPKGLRVDAHGCVIVNQVIELRGVTFEFNRARLDPNALGILDGVARAFPGQPSLRVEISGHTDSIGGDAANLLLSQKRADAVRNYLISKGASSSQLVAHGYGRSKPLISPERSDEDRERNRRVEFNVIAGN